MDFVGSVISGAVDVATGKGGSPVKNVITTTVKTVTINTITIIITTSTNIIAIIVTRPKPAYGRQGLAGSWGQDTDQAGTFWGVFNVSLHTSGAQLRYKLTWNHKKPTWNHGEP